MNRNMYVEYKILSKDREVLFTIFSNADNESIMRYIREFHIKRKKTLKRMDFCEFINSCAKHNAYDSLIEVLRCETDGRPLTFKMTKREPCVKSSLA